MYKYIFFIVYFFLFISCKPSHQTVNLTRAPVTITHNEYPEVLKRWTRNGKIIWKFDTTLNVYATMLSWEYRWAYSILYTYLYNLDEATKKILWSKQIKELDSSIEFVVSAASANPNWIDFEKGTPKLKGPAALSGSIWKITLKVDDKPEIYPLQIKKIRKTKLHENMFSYIGHFHKLYIVRFPIKYKGKKVLSETAKKIILRFRSPLGKTDLVWITNNMYYYSE